MTHINEEGDTMDLFEAIKRRKSCRSYTGQPLDRERLEEIRGAIGGFEPLDPHVALEYRFATETKGLFKVEAPHYLIVSGQGKDGEPENAGFLYEQLILWLDARDIGSVWLGKAKDVEQNPKGKDIITIAFGQPKEAAHRGESEFKRKPIGEITNAPEDPCIQAVHLAPSGMNLQPWYWEKTDGKVLLYEQILRPPVSLAYNKTAVDMGIALCHYALACKHFDKPFAFQRRKDEGEKKGYRLFGELA
jgi:hypothetical protein